jgi:hypothetical protein
MGDEIPKTETALAWIDVWCVDYLEIESVGLDKAVYGFVQGKNAIAIKAEKFSRILLTW